MDYKIESLSTDASDVVFEKVGKMFVEMYEFMESKGLILSLAENGENIWLNSIKTSLGKLNEVLIAFHEGEIIGFVAGNIKLGPAFLGSKKIGYISHVYVVPQFRKSDVGHSLIAALEDWFYKYKVDHIEGEVLYQNESALKFFEELEYTRDNIRIFKNNTKRV